MILDITDSEDFKPDTIRAGTSDCNMQLGALPCDSQHHFYHYQSSAQYLWLGDCLRALGREEEARAAYANSVFQDHRNAVARQRGSGNGEQGLERRGANSYELHPLSDAAFCASIGVTQTQAGKWHDEARQSGDVTLLDKAIALDPLHSDSFFARGKIRFAQKDYEGAREDFQAAVGASHRAHDAYHRSASEAHLERGRQFLAAGEVELAIQDFTKALNLQRGNKAALAARAGAYRQKGSERLARADEIAIIALIY